MERNSADLFLSVITVAEVEDGIARCRRTSAYAKAERLACWLETMVHLYASRILPIDVATARRIGVLADHTRGPNIPSVDSLSGSGLSDTGQANRRSLHLGYEHSLRRLRI